nr:MAG TPA: hypothetical protein [Caudoviricetes sp.]
MSSLCLFLSNAVRCVPVLSNLTVFSLPTPLYRVYIVYRLYILKEGVYFIIRVK